VSRQLLNDLPDSVLALIFIGAAVGFALVATVLVRRFAPQWRDEASSEKVIAVAAMVMTLFALLLAFLIVNLYGGYQEASNNVGAEANSMGAVVTDAEAFPLGERKLMNGASARYIREVRFHEFPLLRDGRTDPKAQTDLEGIVEALERYTPRTQAQVEYYRVTAEDLDTVGTQRTNLVNVAPASVPGPLLGLLILLAVLTLITAALIKTSSRGLDLVLCVSIAVAVGAGTLTAALLEYPFSGSIAVTAKPFDRPDLNQVLQGNRVTQEVRVTGGSNHS
jgi:hypothetical protein